MITSHYRYVSTNRIQLIQLRKFFRSQLALKCPVDIVEALMGHSGYLTEAYRRYSQKQMAEFYQNTEHLLYVSMPQDIQRIESEFKEELNTNRKLIQDIVSENNDLKKDVKSMKEILNKMAEAMSEGKLPEGLFFDEKNKKIVLEQ